MSVLSNSWLEVQDLMLSGPSAADNRDGRGSWHIIAGVANLLQAIWVRLNTPEGSLASLGHPEYGSRLYLLIGKLDVVETRERARLYIARALAREPRVDEILSIQVTSDRAGSGRILHAVVNVRPVEQRKGLQFAFSIALEPDL